MDSHRLIAAMRAMEMEMLQSEHLHTMPRCVVIAVARSWGLFAPLESPDAKFSERIMEVGVRWRLQRRYPGRSDATIDRDFRAVFTEVVQWSISHCRESLPGAGVYVPGAIFDPINLVWVHPPVRVDRFQRDFDRLCLEQTPEPKPHYKISCPPTPADFECPVCLKDDVARVFYGGPRCKHMICVPCSRILLATPHARCPLCRGEWSAEEQAVAVDSLSALGV